VLEKKTFASVPVLMVNALLNAYISVNALLNAYISVNALLNAYISVLCREKPETNHVRYSTTNSYDLIMLFVIISSHYCGDHTEKSFNSEIVFQYMKSVYWAASEKQTEKRHI
jgi:hypothetical protein